jgi:hypothetical protein
LWVIAQLRDQAAAASCYRLYQGGVRGWVPSAPSSAEHHIAGKQ